MTAKSKKWARAWANAVMTLGRVSSSVSLKQACKAMESMGRTARRVNPSWKPKRKNTTPCYMCGVPVEGYEALMCCSGGDCGCRGLPQEPPLCPKCDRVVFGKGSNAK